MFARRAALAAALLAALVVPAALPVPAAAQGFTGAGSTFAFPILAQWARAYNTQQGEGGAVVDGEGGLDYEPVGSLGGITRVLAGAVDFGATDAPLTPAEVDQHRLLQFPLVVGAVAIVTSIPGVVAGALRLSGDVVARIYLGDIRRWNDPAIRDLNPGLILPDAPIAVIHREDGSGTTWNFANWLAAASPEWQQKVGVDTLLNWPIGRGGRGNPGVASLVRTTPGAIGYVEAGQATRLGMATALVRNEAGRFVAPTREAIAADAATAAWDPARHFFDPRSAATAAEAYPITTIVYALMPRRPVSNARARRALAFFELALGSRAIDAQGLGYVPLPEPVVAQIRAYWRQGFGR
jgi:phosphate transport system substrate-binding protein